MARSVVYVVSDDFMTSQKARTWGQENGCDVKVFSHTQWNNTFRDLTSASGYRTDGVVLTGGAQPVAGGKVLSFPSNTPGKKVASMDEIESQAIVGAINEYKGNLTEAAKALGIGRATLYRKVKQYGIDPSAARNKGSKAA